MLFDLPTGLYHDILIAWQQPQHPHFPFAVLRHEGSVPSVSKMAVVKTEQGLLEGTVCENAEGSYTAFKGIPYAKPPIGNLRFKARISLIIF
ncbi:hypothetical protein MSG28_006236 [Choristoneura fumiferana]|uniref:Uncharacterized protein n=1 Tax=Choristoneura fumiferana TaxID=7141 RepID=A0ACC0JE16_CHOFU|nr:hypothetical protein MSG28_006236 [Choristoneura fumiferana]